MPISVSIVEDDAGIRQGLVRLLKRSPDFRLMNFGCGNGQDRPRTSLGDVIRTRPVVADLHRLFPGVTFDWTGDELCTESCAGTRV